MQWGRTLRWYQQEGIKAELRGEWCAFINPIGDESYELCMTRVKGTDFISFVLDNTKFQICRIKEYAWEKRSQN